MTAIVLKALEIRKYFTVALSWGFREQVSAAQGFEGGGSIFFPPDAGPLFLLPSTMRGRGEVAWRLLTADLGRTMPEQLRRHDAGRAFVL
ncbi:MAG TPA: hypothetical protein VFW49_10760 [Fluviicoccus sp.]|nr:hypothetical protein [Fluviicoccus sp.]